MRDLLNNPGVIAIITTIIGTIGLKIVEHRLGKNKADKLEYSTLRSELRLEIQALREQLSKADEEERRLESLLDEWKEKYYDLRGEQQRVVNELFITSERLKALEESLKHNNIKE